MFINTYNEYKSMLKKQGNNNPDVTAVVTAITDGERPFLQETVKAVLLDPGIGQVVLCIEDRNTWIDEVLGSLADDSRLEIIRLPLAIPPTVRNQALKYVRLPWIAFCDGDDVWCQGKTQKQRAYAESTGSDFVGADHYLTDEAGRVRAVAQARTLPMPSSWLVRTDIMKQYPFDESVQVGSDGEWWIRINRTNKALKKARYAELLLYYRVRSGSISSSTPSKRRKAKIVAVASLPVVGQSVFLVTWLAWMLTRRDNYIWLSAWGKQPLADVNSIQNSTS